MTDVSLLKMPSNVTGPYSMKSPHFFEQMFSVVRKRAITWANAGPDLYRHVASQGHSE